MIKTDLDVVVVGCGISGISTGYHLQKYCPDRTFVILERRETLGGTWDLMRYPGIRSDSDMYTFGYSWRGWRADSIISPREEIIEYLNETVDEIVLRSRIRFNTNVLSASFSSETSKWTVTAEDQSGQLVFACNFLFFNTGYFDYDNPYMPEFNDMNKFKGKIIHPQHWDEGYDYTNQRIIVIGSGATAATLVPVLAERGAAHVTMLQRSPSYYVSAQRSKDPLYNVLRRVVSDNLAFKATHTKFMLKQILFYKWCKTFPVLTKQYIMNHIRNQVPSDFDVETHFNPKYCKFVLILCAFVKHDTTRSMGSTYMSHSRWRFLRRNPKRQS